MDTEIIVAIIGAVGVIGAAIIAKIGKQKKEADPPIRIKQTAFGKNITQTGIQNNYASKDGEKNG